MLTEAAPALPGNQNPAGIVRLRMSRSQNHCADRRHTRSGSAAINPVTGLAQIGRRQPDVFRLEPDDDLRGQFQFSDLADAGDALQSDRCVWLKKRVIHCALKFCMARSAWLMPNSPQKSQSDRPAASAASQTAMPNRRERNDHNAQASNTHCPQKNDCVLGWHGCPPKTDTP